MGFMTDGWNDFLINIIANVFRAYLYYRMFKTYFDRRLTGIGITVLMYMAFVCVTQAVYFIYHIPLLTISANIFMLFILSLCYGSGMLKKIAMVSIWYMINMGCDIAAVYLLGDYGGGGNYNLTAPCVMVMLFACVEFIAEYYAGKKYRNDLPMSLWGILILSPLLSILIMVVMLEAEGCSRKVMVISNACLVLINLMFIFLYNHFVESNYEMYENLVYKERSRGYAAQLNIMVENDEKIRSLRHDLRNHFMEIRNLAERDDKGALIEYIDSMGEYIKNPQEYSKSGNHDIDGMLNYLLSDAENLRIRVEIKVSVPSEIYISLFDLNVILGNLINNAKEAVCKCKDRWIDIDIGYDKEILFIQIKNPYNGDIHKMGEEYVTTKMDGGEHGIGLKNVKKIVKKNGGRIKMDASNGIFTSRIMLYGGTIF